MSALILVAIWVLVIFIGYLSTKSHMYFMGRKIPGPKGFPFVGNALMFLGKPNDVFVKLGKLRLLYKRLVALWIGPRLTVALFDPRDAEVVLRATRVMEKAPEYRFLRPWLGDSLLLSRGEKFRRSKKLIMPTFHINILKQYVDIFSEGAKQLVKSLQKEVGKEEFDIQNYLYMNMLSTLLETTMGVSHKNFNSEKIVEYGLAVADVCKIVHIRSYKLWYRSDFLFNLSKLKKVQDEALSKIHPMTEEVIKQRKKEIEARLQNGEHNFETGEHTKKRSILLDLLLETSFDGAGFSDQEIKDEVLTMMFAGQDTTSVSIGFVLSLLGIHIDVQEKVYAELEEIFGNSDREPTFDDLQKLLYMERVIQETWRLFPPIPLIAREATQDFQLETCTIPAKTTLVIIIMALHRNPEQFENPNKFNPDNFLPEKVKGRHPYAFVPFSAGYRMCVGPKYAMLNIKVVLSTILRNYTISSKRKERNFVMVGQTTLKRREGFPICITPRENAPILNMTTISNMTTNSANITNQANEIENKL